MFLRQEGKLLIDWVFWLLDMLDRPHGSVQVGTREANVAVPKIEVKPGQTQVAVPSVEVRRPEEAQSNAAN